MEVGGKHRTTLVVIFADPVRANIAWRDIETLFVACGGEVSEGSGSSVRMAVTRTWASGRHCT